MSLSKEELLRPRFKVIADYPCSLYKMGEIISCYTTAGTSYLVSTGDHNDGTYRSEKGDMADYPSIFRPLEWWEEREQGDMPDYVKCIRFPGPSIVVGKVYKVDEWFVRTCAKSNGEVLVMETNCFEPASYVEYFSIQSAKEAVKQ